jgi:DNA-binding response OmpR family regulator
METAIASRGTILVCDDDADIRETLDAVLTSENFKVHTVSGYEEMRPLLVNIQPDAILLDICMPEYDGFYVADSLRDLGEKAPIIFITAYDNPKRRLSASFVSRVYAYLKKPFNPDELLAVVDHAIQSARRRSGRTPGL